MPIDRLAVYVHEHPSLLLSEEPVVTWTDGKGCTRVGQVDATTGLPSAGGYYRQEEGDSVIEEVFTLEASDKKDNCMSRYTDEELC